MCLPLITKKVFLCIICTFGKDGRLIWDSYLLTYLLIRRYNRFAVLACLRSVRNRSRSRAFVFQSVIPALMSDASTPSYHLNLGLPRLICPCVRHKKTLRAGSSVSMRITWPAHRSLGSLIPCTTVRSPYSSYSSSL